MIYRYWLPDSNGNKTEYITETNSVLIVGANGSGKSKLGAWIEQQDFQNIHRVGAQRNLNFNENIPLKNYTEAESLVFYGREDSQNRDKGPRWGFGHYTTKLMDDFNNVLSALIAMKNNEIDQFHQECKSIPNKNDWPDTPFTSIDKLKEIWTKILPQRKLIEEDSKFYALLTRKDEEVKYSATEMSDGERAVLYLTSQVLCVPNDKIIIIDEPEVHLHQSIMNQLWRTLEQHRPDCLFIYITHDLDFAAAHGNADKIWIKDYDGEKWTFEKIESENLPEKLTMEILGSRKNVLFVEGEKNSFDYQLYSQIYPDYLIVPCGSCVQVIARTKAFRASSALHDCEVYGLIDRDYRSEYEINALRTDNIFVLKVAEVENLFLVEGIIRIIAQRLGQDPDQTFNRVKDFVIDTKFANMINRQICQSVVEEIKYKITCIEISKRNEEEAKQTLDAGLAGINYDAIKIEKEANFQTILNSRDYNRVLEVFNEKEIASSVGAQLGLDTRKFQETVINLLHGECHDEIVNVLMRFLPTEIPRKTAEHNVLS